MFCDSVKAKDGATQMIKGSVRQVCRLVELPDMKTPLKHKDAMKRLAKEDETSWVKDLITQDKGTPAEREQRFMHEGAAVEGIHMQVVELTGEPGDIVLFDPRILHTYSSKTTLNPRSVIRMDMCRTIPTNSTTAL